MQQTETQKQIDDPNLKDSYLNFQIRFHNSSYAGADSNKCHLLLNKHFVSEVTQHALYFNV